MQMLMDFRYSLRLLRRTPAFTAVTLVVIVVGLALFITSYSFGRLLTDKPLPFPNGDRFVALKTLNTQFNADLPFGHDLFTLNHIANNTDAYVALGGFSRSSYSLSNGESGRQFWGASVSVELFNSTSISPILGRSFIESDAALDAIKVVMLGYTPWQEFYGGAEDVVGRTVEINGQVTTIIGVMPEGFQFPTSDNLWLPLSISAAVQPGEGGPHAVAGILKDDWTLQAAEVELNAAMLGLYEEFPEYYANRSELVLPYASLADPTRPVSAAGFVFYITLIILALSIVNLSSLLFMRSNSREHELAVRSSVGSTNWQLSRQVLFESFLICFIGFVLSLLVSTGLLYVWGQIMASRPGTLLFWFDFSLDANAIIAGLQCTIAVWLSSGLLVSVRAARAHAGEVLQGSTSKTAQRKGKAISTNLVVGIEVVLSCFLLVACSFIVRAMVEAAPEFGIETDEFIVGKVNFANSNYSDTESRATYLDEIKRNVEMTAEITAMEATTAPVGVPGFPTPYNLDDRDLSSNDGFPTVASVWVTRNYFDTIGYAPSRGRFFDNSDVSSSELVAVINSDFAQQLWPEQTAIGKRILLQRSEQERAYTVIGVVSSILQSSSELGRTNPVIYLSLEQDVQESFYILGAHQAGMNSADLERNIITAAAAVDRDITVREIRSLTAEIDSRSAGFGVITNIFVTFSVATLMLAAIGIYGVLARNIALRTGDIGIRRALGSSDIGVVARYLRHGFYFLSAGAVFGGGSACIAIIALLSSGAYSGLNAVTNSLPTLVGFVVTIMAIVIFLSCYIPARRAVVLEPGDALRYE